MDTKIQYICEMFGVSEQVAAKMIAAGFRAGEEDIRKASEMLYEDTGLNDLMVKVKEGVSELKSKEGFEDRLINL